MIRRFLNWLSGPTATGPDPLDVARRRREVAWLAYQAAKHRNDTRGLHWAERRLRRATTAMMHLELGR